MIRTTLILSSSRPEGPTGELIRTVTMGQVRIKDLPRVAGLLYAIVVESEAQMPTLVATLTREAEGRYRARFADIECTLTLIQTIEGPWGITVY